MQLVVLSFTFLCFKFSSGYLDNFLKIYGPGEFKSINIPTKEGLILIGTENSTFDAVYVYFKKTLVDLSFYPAIDYVTRRGPSILARSQQDLLRFQGGKFRVLSKESVSEGIPGWTDPYWHPVVVQKYDETYFWSCTLEKVPIKEFILPVTYVGYDLKFNAYVSNKESTIIIQAKDMFRHPDTTDFYVPTVHLPGLPNVRDLVSLLDNTTILATELGPKRIILSKHKIDHFVQGNCSHVVLPNQIQFLAAVDNSVYNIQIDNGYTVEVTGFQGQDLFEKGSYIVDMKYIKVSDDFGFVVVATQESAIYIIEDPFKNAKKSDIFPNGLRIQQLYYRPPYEELFVLSEDLFYYNLKSSTKGLRFAMMSGRKLIDSWRDKVYIATYENVFTFN